MKQSINIFDRIETIKTTLNRFRNELDKKPENKILMNKRIIMVKRLENLSKYIH